MNSERRMNSLAEVKTLLADFQEKHGAALDGLPGRGSKLREACRKIERSWSGSFAGWHGKMYFGNYETPTIYQMFSGEWGGINGIPDGWEEKQAEEEERRIDELVGNGFSSEKYKEEVKSFRSEAEQLRDDVLTAFSSF